MDAYEILSHSIIVGIELHVFCLGLVFMLFVNMRKSFLRSGRKEERSLVVVYLGVALMIISDCAWSTVSGLGKPGNALSYVINLVYFFSSSTAAAYWLVFCIKNLEINASNSNIVCAVSLIPYAIVTLFYILSPIYGFIFKIEDGSYIRGSLFFLDPVIKMGYIIASSALALISGSKKNAEYLRKNDYHFALFGIPVIICGALQVIIGYDFNCLGVTIGLILIFITGITNSDNENTDAIYSLANSFEASYIVNMDTGIIRALHKDDMHDRSLPGMESMDFSTHFYTVLSGILIPEDRIKTLEMFSIPNILKRFEIDNAFSIRYRVKEKSGITALHSASFINAVGNEGKQEFLLGINTLQSDSLIYERNEKLCSENQRMEQINNSIIESVAKMVEARDGGSGTHIVRVRKLTEIIAKGMMVNFPELGLDEETVKIISSASVLHDVGKISIPDSVLLKPGNLTKEELAIMKSHSIKGCDILNNFPLGLDDAFLEYAMCICRWHHERYDGKGYPDGLKGDEIPVAAQIVSAADCFDALVSERPYKKVFSPEVALTMIAGGQCGEFSPKIISVLESQRSKLVELARLYR